MATSKRQRRPRSGKTSFDVPLNDVMRRDYFRLRHEQDPKRRQQGIERSTSQRQARADALDRLALDLPASLPITEHADEIKALMRSHQVVVVAGETGSGKTTQLPKLCMQLGYGVRGMIGHTQPRRLAARTVAKRIAEEVGTSLGDDVGYAVRFSDQVGDGTLLKVMTDGLLLTEIRSDRYLDAYDVIIIDEAHERSLNIDFLLGYLKRLVQRRKDLKLIVTSATIDVERFAEFFGTDEGGPAPIVGVSGRTYPVEVRYQGETEDLLDAVTAALQEIDRMPLNAARDVLVFFSGEREIFEAARVLRKSFSERLEVLPLYARLSFSEQQKIFAPSGSRRRVVLATNVAETSLTVPNIGYVIDPGLARINRYSYRSKLQRLPIEPISKASADQRKGRCGRIAPGLCYRLYTELDFQSRPDFTDAEIHRVNLASVVLQMQAFRLGEISRFPFIDPPDPRAIKDAVRLLEELQALQRGKLSEVGRAMARMPVDPRLARMLVEAHRQGAVRELLVVVAALAVQDPRERPLQKAQAADESHAKFADDKSDFLSQIKLWDWLEEQRQALTRGRYATLLKKRFLSAQRVREWREVHRQLRLVCRELGYRENTTPANYQAVHESILAGSLSLIGQHDERGQYLGARNLKMRIFPGSGLAGRTPKWIVAGEIAETSRVYARQVAFVEPGWIERQAAHLIKSQFSGPFWSLKRGETMAHKNVNLYGLRLAERRLVSYSQIDPAVSRDLFIREGLVHGRVQNPPAFLQHNLLEVARVEDLEAKGRRRDLLVSEDDQYHFYASRLPAEVVRMNDLNKWLNTSKAEQTNALFVQPSDLLRGEDAALAETDYPSALTIDGLSLPLSYRFAPGEPDDGVSVDIPVGVLAAVGAEPLEWLVPGLLPNLVEQWLRTLPKQKRRVLVPLPDKVDELSQRLLRPERYRQGRLLAALGSLLRDAYRIEVGETDWDRERVATHLKMFVRVLDTDGKTLACGRDLRLLKDQLTQEAAPGELDRIATTLEAQSLTDFPALTLQRQQILGDQKAPVVRFPGFVDRGDSVDLELFEDEHARDIAHRRGLSRLALCRLGQVGSYFRRELDKHPKLGLHFAGLGNAQALKDEILRNTIWYCFFEGLPLPTDPEEFSARLLDRRPLLADVFNQTVGQFAEVMALRFACVTALEELQSAAYDTSKQDIAAQLDRLAPKNLLEITPRRYLAVLSRYLRGIQRRIENLPGHVPKDLKLIKEMQPLLQRFDRLCQAELADQERCLDLGFYLEELRLTLFAEPVARSKVVDHPLDTAYFAPGWKASLKRVGQQLLLEEQRVGLA